MYSSFNIIPIVTTLLLRRRVVERKLTPYVGPRTKVLDIFKQGTSAGARALLESRCQTSFYINALLSISASWTLDALMASQRPTDH